MRKIGKFLLIVLVIIALFFLWNEIKYKKIELPEGSMVVLDRIFHNHSVRIGNIDYQFDSDGNCRMAYSKTNKTIKYLDNYKVPRYILFRIEYAKNL